MTVHRLGITGEIGQERRKIHFRAATREELEPLRRIRHTLYRWRTPFPPDIDPELDSLPPEDVRYFIATDGDRFVGGSCAWICTGRFEGFDANDHSKALVRTGRLVIHPDLSGTLMTVRPPDGEPLRRVPIGLGLMSMMLATGLRDFQRRRFLAVCLPRMVGMYTRLGFEQGGPAFEHDNAFGEGQPPHEGKYLPMMFDYDHARTAWKAERAGLVSSLPAISVLLFGYLEALCQLLLNT